MVGRADVLAAITGTDADEAGALKKVVDVSVDATVVLLGRGTRGQDFAGDGFSPVVGFCPLSVIHDNLAGLLSCVVSSAPQIAAIPKRVAVAIATPRHPEVVPQLEMVNAEHGHLRTLFSSATRRRPMAELVIRCATYHGSR